MIKKYRPSMPLEDQVLCEVWQTLSTTDELNRANNCYSYAVGSLPSILDSRARSLLGVAPQPGDRSGIPKAVLLLLHYRSLPFWIKLAERDGLTRLDVRPTDPLPELRPSERLTVLMYNMKLKDYHWLRREQNGLWTHKPDSARPPTWYDAQLQLIHDPRHAALWDYNSACVFFKAPLEGVDVRMPKGWLKFFGSLEGAALGNVEALRTPLQKLAEMVRPSFDVFSDYIDDLARHGADSELQKFARHLHDGLRLPNADGLLPFSRSYAHVPLGLAWTVAVK